MSSEKLSSDAVPAKFAEWLLSMGCPPEKVPYLEKISEMSRGQYFMVWRSLMERVESKDIIRHKRLQVFCDDMRKCKQRNVLNEPDASTVIPEQLKLWREHSELSNKLEGAKSRVSQVKQELGLLKDKISKKLLKRDSMERGIANTQRRAWLLHSVSEELAAKKEELKETRAIADSLCSIDQDGELEEKLDKCVSWLRQNPTQTEIPAANGVESEFEQQLCSVIRCRGDALCSSLLARRAALARELATPPAAQANKHRVSPKSVVAHTAAMHCRLALAAAKNRAHEKRATAKFAPALIEINNYLPTESCELLVLQCEKASAEARVKALRSCLDEIASRSGDFHCDGEAEDRSPGKSIASVDKAIESNRASLSLVLSALDGVERKLSAVKEAAAAVFAAYRDDPPRTVDTDLFRGLQVEMPSESLASIRAFYGRRRRPRLSLDMDLSDHVERIDTSDPRFIDELRIYLKTFNLERNRKLVLESGEKMWYFETLAASLSRVRDGWLQADVSGAILTQHSTADIQRAMISMKEALEAKTVEHGIPVVKEIDIKPQIEEEQQTVDQIKKRLKDNIVALQKTNKNLDIGKENLDLWASNHVRKYISSERKVDGVAYKDYEAYYLSNCIN